MTSRHCGGLVLAQPPLPPRLHVMFNAWPGPAVWYRNSLTASLRSMVDRLGGKGCPPFASMRQQCPRSFKSSVLHTQIVPAVVWRHDPEDFDLNLTAWEAEMFVLFHMSDIIGTGLGTGHMPAFCSCLNCQDCSLLCNQNVRPGTPATWNPNTPAACAYRSRTTEQYATENAQFHC